MSAEHMVEIVASADVAFKIMAGLASPGSTMRFAQHVVSIFTLPLLVFPRLLQLLLRPALQDRDHPARCLGWCWVCSSRGADRHGPLPHLSFRQRKGGGH